jgi:iron complex outermembrane receptor protein
MRYFCFIFLLFGALNGLAQQEIRGRVTDEQDLPLSGATVTLKQEPDAKMLTYAIADSAGKFRFKSVKPGNYRLEVAFMTYKSQIRVLTVGTGPLEAQNFKLLPETQQLQEVSIKGRKQAISVSAGKTTMNVEQSSLAQSQSAYDLLKSLPGVNVNKDGEIRIKGKSGVTVMINGEPAEMGASQLKSLLKGTPGTTLQSIEVMNNPPSSMDASGTGGVINLVFKKKVKKGFNGTWSSNVSKGRYYNTDQSLNVTYGTEKWDMNVLYAYDFEHSQNRDSMFRAQLTGDANPGESAGKHFYMTQLQLNREKSKSHMVKLGLDHHFNAKNTLGLNLSFNDLRNPTHGRTISRFGTGTVEDSLLNQRNELNSTLRNWDYGLKFKHKFNELKSLTASAQFSNLKSDGMEDFTVIKSRSSVNLLQDLRYRNSYPSKINRKIFKMDYVEDLKKGDQKFGKFEAGLKSSNTSLSNSQFGENWKAGDWKIDQSRIHNFRYREAIQAAYGAMELNLEPWTVNVGLRGEYTQVKGEAGTESGKIRQNYFSLFPNALVGYKAGDQYSVSLSYNRRIERPDYDQLNPSVRYLDLYTTQQGNPKLKAQLSNNIELNQQFFSFIDVSFGYSSIKNPIYSAFVTTPGANSSYTNINTGHQQQWQASVAFPIPGIDWWENYQSFYFYTSQFNANLDNVLLKEKANSFGLLSYNSFKLPASFNLELTAWYQSGGLFSNFRYKPMSEVTAGLNKKLLDDRLTLGLAVADAFYGGVFKAAVLSDRTQSFKIDSRTDSRQVKFSISWNFGKKQKTEKSSAEPADDDRLPSGKGKPMLKPVKP